MDRGAWWATVNGIEKNWTQLEQLSMHTRKDYPGGPVVKAPSFCFGNAGVVGLIPGQRTKIPHAAW